MSIATLADYRRIVRDYDNYDGDVISALTAAQQFIEAQCNRFFDYADEDDVPIVRTEVLRVHGDGRVYPHATPVVSVSDPADSTVALGAITWPGTWFSDLSSDWPWQPSERSADVLLAGAGRSVYPRISVTYTGGYAEAPEDLKRLVCLAAKSDMADSLNIPVGATSVKSGDISYSGPNLGQSYNSTIWTGIIRWRRREI